MDVLRRTYRTIFVALIACLLIGHRNNARPAAAGDWPQILGPNRNGVAIDEKLAKRWSAEGPPLLWQRAVGRGYAGVAISGARAILFYRSAGQGHDDEILEAVDLKDGSRLWKVSWQAHFTPMIFPDKDGPLCVPLIHNDRVFAFGAGGDLVAVDFKSGRLLWSRDLYRQYRRRGGTIDYGYFGAGSAPILHENRLLLNVGGRAGAGILAIDCDSGKNIWQSTDEGASYSSPVSCVVNGDRHVIFVTRYHTLSLDPDDGRVRFRFPFGRRGPTVNAASPVIRHDLLFTTASYGVGSRLTRIAADGEEKIWADERGFASQYNTPIFHDGYLYGTDGRADVNSASLRCIEMKTGKEMWKVANFGVAALILVGDELLIIRSDGKLMRALADPQQFFSRAEAQLTQGTVRALPALSEGRLLIRDDSQIYCYDVGSARGS